MNKKITNGEELEEAIAELELIAAAQKRDIQESLAELSEDLKPVNLVKESARYIFSGKNREGLVNVLIGLGTGFLSRKLLLGRSHGVVSKTLGKAVQYGMAGVISQNAEKIKEKAGIWIDRLFKRKKPDSNHTPAEIQNRSD
jgi:hypothetical protein